eukprot:gene9083-6376_t
MAKSSRSKWKKLHRRQRAQAEAHNTVKRVSRLNKKLKLTAHGGISLVPPQDPETRFHFTNPEKNLRVPDPRREFNNNYRNDRTVIDFSKPLKLAPPKSNFYGKSDINAPHIMTVNYDVIDADAPIAGHALTKADVERSVRKALEAQEKASRGANEEELPVVDEDQNSDGPEEYVFGMEDSAPRKVSKSAKKSSDSSHSKGKKKLVLDNEESNEPVSDAVVSHKIRSIAGSTGGTSKVKKFSRMSGSSASRVTSSGSKSKKKKA